MPELDRYNPNISLANLASTFRTLDSEVQQRIQASDYQEFQSLSGIEDFQLQVADFLENFGYLSESAVDFSHVPWHENPDLVLKIIIEYPAFSEQTLTKISLRDLSPGWLSGIVIRSFYRRARLFRYYREAFSSLFSRVLGLLRSHYLALAEQLSHNETLLIPDDIFYLYHDELKKIVSDDMNDIEVKRLIAERKEEMEQSKGVELPEVIFGDTAPPAVVNAKKTFSGVPTSRGYYTGRVKVIEKLSEFPKLQPGNVLVIPFSDTGWLPLFRKAGAVIAESGGMLSHSSIIAREYNIPAVVSVAGALLLKDDTLVHVDGFKGEIKIIEG